MTTLAHKFFETASLVKKEKEDKTKKEWEDKLNNARNIFKQTFLPKITEAANEGMFEASVWVFHENNVCEHAMICVIEENGFLQGGFSKNQSGIRFNVSWSNPGLKGNR